MIRLSHNFSNDFDAGILLITFNKPMVLSRLTSSILLYRVWQGSDFDINAELAEQEVQLCTLNVADKLNETSVFLPFVAKKYSIEKHSL
jgi:hypothetical protein